MSNKASIQKNRDLRQLVLNTREELNSTVQRLNKEKEEQKIFAIAKFAKDILEVNDNLDRAIKESKDEFEGKGNTLFDGVLLIKNVLSQV